MTLNPENKTIKAFDGFRYKHVRSENIDELINHMGMFTISFNSKSKFKLSLNFRL